MAIADGMAIICSDLQAVGGTRIIALRVWTSLDTVTYDTVNQEIDVIKSSGGVATEANWGVYESRIESSSLTVSASNEGKDTTTYECTLSWFIPGMTKDQFKKIHDFDGQCLMALVIDNNDATSGSPVPSTEFARNKVIGACARYQNDDKQSRSQSYARLLSVEGGTGAAFSDEIGVTVTLVATQYEIPFTYVGTIELGATGLTLTTS